MSNTLRGLLVSVSIFLFIFIGIFWGLYVYSSSKLKQTIEMEIQHQIDQSAYILDLSIKETELHAMGIVSNKNKALVNKIKVVNESNDALSEKKEELDGLLEKQMKIKKNLQSISLYLPSSKVVFSSDKELSDNESINQAAINEGWFITNHRIFYATRYIDAIHYPKLKQEEYSIVVELSKPALEKRLKQLTTLDYSNSFVLLPDKNVSAGSSPMENYLIEKISKQAANKGKFNYENKEYLYYVRRNIKSGVSIVTYLARTDVLTSISRMKYIFIGIFIFIIIVATVAFLLLYMKFFKEFKYVFTQMSKLQSKNSDLNTSLSIEKKNREQAELKQLQLQINPHFFYNSLGYLVSVSDDSQSVISMSSHLASYYRYSMEDLESTTIAKEFKYIEDYLEIMMLRKSFEYLIDVDESIENQEFLPTIVEPLVENAIQHGLSSSDEVGFIAINVKKFGNTIRVEVEDDGKGMSEPDRARLYADINRSERNDNTSVGLWNVNQRLIKQYGLSAKLQFKTNQMGGLTVFFIREINNER